MHLENKIQYTQDKVYSISLDGSNQQATGTKYDKSSNVDER